MQSTFNINDHLDRLESTGEKNRYFCPVCQGNNLTINPDNGAYNCWNGCELKSIRDAIAPLPEKRNRPQQKREWVYCDAEGNPVAKVLRVDDGSGNKKIWQNYCVDGQWQRKAPAGDVGRLLKQSIAPYRWHEIKDAEQVFWVEGEPLADALWQMGIPATTTIGGCDGLDRYGNYAPLLSGKSLVLCPDMDQPGLKYAKRVAAMAGAVKWVYAFPNDPRWKNLPAKGGIDLLDWIEAGATKEQILNAITDTPLAAIDKTKDAPAKSKLCKMLQLEQDIKLAVGSQLRLNQLTQQIEYQGETVKAGRYKLFLARLLNEDVSRDDATELLGAIAEENAYHPVKEYLEGVYERYGDSTIGLLDKPAALLLGTNKPIYDVYLRNRLIGSVARIYRPGCKLDELTVLHGKQGIGKSTFWKVLAGEEFFSDSLGKDLSNKDELLKLHKCWFMELDELDRVTSYKEASETKSFTSHAVDTFRAPYERASEDHPRMCSIVASVNKTEFLVDETGNRRFQVITVTDRIDLKKVAQLRDRLWAAAVARYKRGDDWHLSPEEEAIAAEDTKQYESTDLWFNSVVEFLEQEENLIRKGEQVYVLPERVLVDALRLEEGRIDHGHKKRLSKVLRELGWEPANNGQPIKLPAIGNRAVRAWVKVANFDKVPDSEPPIAEPKPEPEPDPTPIPVRRFQEGQSVEVLHKNGSWSNGWKVQSFDGNKYLLLNASGLSASVPESKIRDCQSKEPSHCKWKKGDPIEWFDGTNWIRCHVDRISHDVEQVWVLQPNQIYSTNLHWSDPNLRPATVPDKYPLGSKINLKKIPPGYKLKPGAYTVKDCSEIGSIRVAIGDKPSPWIAEKFFEAIGDRALIEELF